MSATPEAAAALGPLLGHLGLHQAAAVLPAWLDRAASQELSYADFLHGLLEEESAARANAATQQRLRQAGFPYAATIEQFDFRFRPELKRQVVLRYLDPTFVEQARSLAVIGAPGLGKTMLAICIATKHVQLGATARFVTAQHLANQLGRATTSAGRQRLLRPLLACDVLVLDELGYLPTLPGFGPALYELIAGRYEHRPTPITSNKSLTEWAAIVQDASLAAALVDRILHHGDVFYLKGPSWRLRGRSLDGELVNATAPHTSSVLTEPDARHRDSGPEDAVP
jgi:DNA replication protein DnaC